MGCKQCKFLGVKPSVEPDRDLAWDGQNTVARVRPVLKNPPIVLSLDDVSPRIQKRSRTCRFKNTDFPSSSTLDTLPVELIYHLLDQLDAFTIFTSLYNVCTRFNSIIQSYDQYHLQFRSIPMSYFHRVCSVIRPEQVVSLTLSDGHDNVGLVKLFLDKFQMESFRRLRTLTLINIADNEQISKIFLAVTDQLQRLSIENVNETYNETVMDILMTLIGKPTLQTLILDIERERLLNAPIIWTPECSLREIRLVGLCNITLLRNILVGSPNLEIFEAFDIDLDDEWVDDDDDEDEDEDNPTGHREMLPIANASNIKSLSLVYARNDMEKLEWFLSQFTALTHLKYLNIYDYHPGSIDVNDYSVLDGQRWEKLLGQCERFEFILTAHLDDQRWDNHRPLTTFQTQFWQEKNWQIALEQFESVLLLYSIPYAHHSYHYDRAVFSSMPNNRFLLSKSMENVTKLRINLPAVNQLEKHIVGPPRFPNVSQLILDGQWKNPDSTDSIASLVCLPKISKLIRLERMPTAIFQAFIGRLSNLQGLTLTTVVLDGMNAAKFEYSRCLPSLNIVQLEDGHRNFVNVEPFCTMFPQIEHLDIPIDSLDSCQYVIDRLKKTLFSVVFRLPGQEDTDADDDDDDDGEVENDASHNALVHWARRVQTNHQYRVDDGDIYLWLGSNRTRSRRTLSSE